MSSPIDAFLLKTMTSNAVLSGGIQSADKEPDLPIFVPVMTLTLFSALSGIPRDILRGNCDKGYIPTHFLGRRRVVNVSLLNQKLLEKKV